ncbi:Hypothetical protein SMAX5B_000070 [Scophthalmus maximus]|uniref:Uncharacterized protein n=1 Tax=Scophthalmus maximus TaxID=52904 RepID=A0A2U9CUY6_SCOMX|nr:Hypothetical protein SMAX5B_000070 [Scophthalmus maximus]
MRKGRKEDIQVRRERRRDREEGASGGGMDVRTRRKERKKGWVMERTKRKNKVMRGKRGKGEGENGNGERGGKEQKEEWIVVEEVTEQRDEKRGRGEINGRQK